jgi:hypothetical protein
VPEWDWCPLRLSCDCRPCLISSLATQMPTCANATPSTHQAILRTLERNLMFERKEGKVYTAEELAETSAALLAQRHADMRDAGKEIAKLLSASNRVIKVRMAGVLPEFRGFPSFDIQTDKGSNPLAF